MLVGMLVCVVVGTLVTTVVTVVPDTTGMYGVPVGCVSGPSVYIVTVLAGFCRVTDTVVSVSEVMVEYIIVGISEGGPLTLTTE